jgi:hypothetical protein
VLGAIIVYFNSIQNKVGVSFSAIYILYFIEYNVHTSKVRAWFSQRFLAKEYFYFSRISKELIIASLSIIKAILNPFSTTFHA